MRSLRISKVYSESAKDVCGLREGDTLLVESWANGVIRMTLAGEEL
jgi:hypothetical protein